MTRLLSVEDLTNNSDDPTDDKSWPDYGTLVTTEVMTLTEIDRQK